MFRNSGESLQREEEGGNPKTEVLDNTGSKNIV